MEFVKRELQEINFNKSGPVAGRLVEFGKKGISILLSALIGASSLSALSASAIEPEKTADSSKTELKVKSDKNETKFANKSYLWKIAAGAGFLIAAGGAVVRSLLTPDGAENPVGN